MLSATSGMMCENHMFYKVFAQFGRSVGVLEPFNFAGLSNLCVYVLRVRGFMLSDVKRVNIRYYVKRRQGENV